jgi:hypothetical protein
MPSGDGSVMSLLRKMEAPEEELVKKDEVVAELMVEHVQLRKELGERLCYVG